MENLKAPRQSELTIEDRKRNVDHTNTNVYYFCKTEIITIFLRKNPLLKMRFLNLDWKSY